MSLNVFLSKVEPSVLEIENNSNEIATYRNIASIAKTASILTYIFTSDSKNKSVKTIGQVASLGGWIYGYSQNSKASNLERKNINLVESVLDQYDQEGIKLVRSEYDTNRLRKFLELILRANRYADSLLPANFSIVKSKGCLGEKNQKLLMNLLNIDVFNQKLRFLNLFQQIDSSKRFPLIERNFRHNISMINPLKLKQEGAIARTIIFSLILIGIALTKYTPLSSYIAIAGILFWGVNHYLPLFSESRKLKAAIKNLTNEFNLTIGISSLTLK